MQKHLKRNFPLKQERRKMLAGSSESFLRRLVNIFSLLAYARFIPSPRQISELFATPFDFVVESGERRR